MVDNKKINEIKNSHKDPIRSLKYFYDNINKRDLIFSISIKKDDDSRVFENLKIWNINNFECLLCFEENEMDRR